MENSAERIAFVADYISAYEEKIRLLNANGLFDAAKLFELFAIEVGGLYLGQKLSNLNIDTYTYPCVDLISEDKRIYIQVSTAKDIPAKIKKTLENIRDSSRVELNTLTNVKFFMLNNDSAEKVKDYKGNDQIGNISFVKGNDLITTSDILQKATDDLEFQIDLYNLLKKETNSIKDNLDKFQDAIENSKTVGLNYIDCKINNEYEIDRNDFVEKIKLENHKNISIQGGAGSGKSVLCKKIVEGEINLIYARAERFIEETDINNIWGFNVRKTLEYLNGKPVVFFIDSLEFIADSRTKLDLLCILYECAKKYPETKIITSCRTSDKNAFMKIESNYFVCSYEVPELTIAEQSAIAKKYSIIEKMLKMNLYAELLKSPFYINLIVSKITDINNISDENQLREHIWQYIICLDDSDVKKVVERIVFTRAKEFSLGSITTDYDAIIIRKLLSEDILISNGNTVRLKYDIFEDICFEQYLDTEFNKCKGNYNEFFDGIGIFGRCIYRRYQIWISNKLFAKNNREKFLFELVFSTQIPQDWKKQTEIGLVKSRYCGQFFIEYGQNMINNGIINDFIRITNLYAFEINGNFKKISPYIQLRPSGEGRGSLINLIAENKLYEKDEILKIDLEKICTDYSKVQLKEKQTAEKACLILEYIIEKYITESEAQNYYKLDGTVNGLLAPIYNMAEYSTEWIKAFWGKLNAYYIGDDLDKRRLAEDIIEDTLKFKHIKLAEFLPMELCNLAEMFWTYSPKKESDCYGFRFYENERRDISFQYGMSENADNYEHGSTKSTVVNRNFFFVLFEKNFWIGLNWTIDFVNKAVLNLAKKNKDLPTYEINFIQDEVKRKYLGFSNMWLVTTQVHNMPMIISDLIYFLKEKLRNLVKIDLAENAEFAKTVTKYIYEKSNNIALLTIIAEIGIEFRAKIPGLALDLATNVDIILFDLARHSSLLNNNYKETLEKQMLLTVGIPCALPDRYKTADIEQYNLRSYVIDSQICYGEDIKFQCHKILDYLYSIVPNDKDNALNYLQIQNMDMRTAKVVKLNDTTISLVPNITGEAKEITIENEKQREPEMAISILINDCNKKINKKEFTLNDCLKSIEFLIKTKNSCIVSEVYNKSIIRLFVIALSYEELDAKTRSRFCQIWIEGIRNYFSNGSFIFDCKDSYVLFEQIKTNVDDEIKKQIKQLILDLILYKGQNGVVAEIACFAKLYLRNNTQVALPIFNTIVKLSEDEMNHQKFNFEHISRQGKEENVEFLPNAQPKFWDNYSCMEADKREKFKSQRAEIIQKYLFDDNKLDLSNFDINNYDITTLCYAANCGLSLDDTSFVSFMKKLIIAIINVWKINEHKDFLHYILGFYQTHEVIYLLQRELLASEIKTSIVLDILFREINFSIFTRDTIEFYLEVFGILLSTYFDAHNDRDKRNNCERIIMLLESNIIKIKEERVKVELYKSLILSLTTYGGAGDWSICSAGYSYQDKQFLNNLFSKYGKFHLKEILDTIYKLHLDKLLPEIILSVRDVLKNASQTKLSISNMRSEIVGNEKVIVLMMISKAYLDFSDRMKQDSELTNAFEEILEMLIEMNYEEAAVILDEFRVH